MIKLLFLIVGLAVGFGGGVYWAVQNPEKAGPLAERQREEVLKLKVQALEKIQQTLDRIIEKQKASATTGGGTPGSSFVSGRTGGGTAKVDPELLKLRNEQERQLERLKQKLQQVEKD